MSRFVRYAPLEERLKRAFERRMGQSVLPLVIRPVQEGVHRVIDTETGSWIDYRTTGWRLHRLAEHDAMAQAVDDGIRVAEGD
ncbi:hypothetical protein [Methylobacterium oryzisoli]|uniref:hypothetical protein n=1 Tax=Methylobacterium oryzisoli TaxID=3385502 RepID=UPI0038914322